MKRFNLSNIWLAWQAEVEIDIEKAAPAIKAMVEFWTDWEQRLEANEGAYLQTFLVQLAREIFYIQAENSVRHVDSVIKAFAGREGWSPMDGSQGIKIISVEEVEFDYSDFSFEEL